MATYKLPPPPHGDKVWIIDSSPYGETLYAERSTQNRRMWTVHFPPADPAEKPRKSTMSWAELFALGGEITDDDPFDLSWLSIPLTAQGGTIIDAAKRTLVKINDGAFADRATADRLAALIARLVNEEASRSDGDLG